MTPEQLQRLESLEREIAELRREIKKPQQLSFPLDPASQKIVDNNKFVVVGSRVAGTPTSNGHFVVSLNGKQYKVMTTA